MSIKVRATRRGYYANVPREPGDEFPIESEKDFSKKWMEKVAPRTRIEGPKGADAVKAVETKSTPTKHK